MNGGIENTLEKEVVQYDFYSSYFDIFVSIFRFIFHFRYNETNQMANFLLVDLKVYAVVFVSSLEQCLFYPLVTGPFCAFSLAF